MHADKRLLLALVCAVMAAPALAASGNPEKTERTWIEIDGTIYGCVPDSTGPIGGGSGYTRTVRAGDYEAVSVEQLIEALRLAQSGDTVFIPGEIVLDFSDRVLAEGLVLKVPAGITLASDRGVGGSEGALLKSNVLQTFPLIRIEGPDVRITGLRIQGPDPERRLEHWRSSFSSTRAKREGLSESEYYYSLPVSRGVYTEFDGLEVDNCELSGWSGTALSLAAGQGHHIHHNSIHHNQRKGLGYGISHGMAFSLIEYNLFAWNRHSIAGGGRPPSGYVARHNLETGHALSHNFDMHGGRDRKDGTNIAGSRIEIYNNTFLGKGLAINIRGKPEEYALIYDNWFTAHFAPGSAVIQRWPVAGTVELGKNLYGKAAPSVQ
jgi:hypothetical protein